MKRIAVIALSAGLVLALGACSSSSSDAGSTSPTTPPPTSTAPAATSAAPETGGLSGTWSGQYDGTFQGTFVRVRRHGHDVVGGFAHAGPVTIVAIPTVSVCE